jgi:hypothetical protein
MTNTLPRPKTATELTLTVENPLLIILSPWQRKNAWWRERCGLLYLRRDGLIEWHSDHQPKSEKLASHEAFKQMIRDGWDVYTTSPALADRQWYEPDLNEWKYEHDRIVFGVDTCNFKPKIFNR